jgi:phospholipase C
MRRPDRSRLLPLAALLAMGAFSVTLSGCGGGAGGPAGTAASSPLGPAKKGKYFTHIVVIVQENRSFDNFFATFPGADGTRMGKMKVPSGSGYVDKWTKLTPHSLLLTTDINHCRAAYLTAYDNGKMDGFNLVHTGVCGSGQPVGTLVYQYVDPIQIAPYWKLAEEYVLADHLFQTQGSGSFTAHQDLIRGGTEINSSESLIDNPTNYPWGCDAPSGTVTSLLTTSGQYRSNQGPFPCLSYETLRDLLDADGVTWKYYTPAIGGNISGDLFNAFDLVSPVRYGPEWSSNVTTPNTRIFDDLTSDSLPSVAWVIPDYENSDHPDSGSDTGPSWVAQVVNAIGQSSAWKTTAIIILWDDWGGFYDHVPPPFLDQQGGLGFRVPAIAVSPFAKAGYVSHDEYEFGSIIRFIEDNWNLGRLGTTDARSADFVHDFFDFSQRPREFVPIAAEYSREYFLRQQPSNKPVDSE